MQDEEIAVIVDERDQFIEFRDRRAVGTYDLHRIVAVWIVNGKGEILIAQRAHSMKNQPGVWGPAAAGTVNKGEEYEDTALRELSEEIGISGAPLTSAGKFRTDRDFGECRMCTVFTGEYDGDIASLAIQPEEVAQVRWITPSELQRQVELHPENFVINMKNVMSEVK